jgi:hypothetical protein
MTRLLLIAGFIVLAAGCTTHHFQVQGNTLALYLEKPDAQWVILSCSLDGFEPHEAKNVDGRWVVSLPSDCQFRYYYVIDGEMFLPPCRMKEKDDFGSENCIFDPHL